MGEIIHTSPIEVQKVLKDIDYPVNKKQLIEHSKKHDASSEVIEVRRPSRQGVHQSFRRQQGT